MKLGLISDVHGNKVALDTVWRKLQYEHHVDETACAGDIVGVLGWPEDTANFIKENVDHVVYGNHDAYVREDHAYTPTDPVSKQEHHFVSSKLTEQTVDWLNSLPAQVEIGEDVVMAHAKPWSDNPSGHPANNYLDMGDWIEWSSSESEFTDQIVVTGHTHEQGALDLSKFEGQDGMIVNPGSLGQPYHQDAKYAILDTDSREVELHRLYFDGGEVKRQIDKLGLKSADSLKKQSTYTF